MMNDTVDQRNEDIIMGERTEALLTYIPNPGG